MNDQFQPGFGEPNANIPEPAPIGTIPPVQPVTPPAAQPVVTPPTEAPAVPTPAYPQPSAQNAYPQPPQPMYQPPVQSQPPAYQPPAPVPPVYQPPAPVPYPSPMAQPGYYPPPQPVKKTNGMAIASMICGIVSLLITCTCCGWSLSIILGILAVVFAIVSRKADDRMSGMAIAGLICGILGLLLGVLIMIAMLTGAMENNVYYNEFWDEWESEYGYYASLFRR